MSADDAGLRAVARVRGVREQDSRIGLQQAISATEQRESAAAEAQQQLDEAPAFAHGSTLDYRASRLLLAALAERARTSREIAQASRANAEEARRRWQHDRSRLRAVQALLERRVEARREEAARRDTRELDDIAGQLWLRLHHDTTGQAGAA